MIQFPCHCGHQFSVDDDLAGGVIQCPQCRRLSDVPLLSDRDNIDEGGIFKLDPGPQRRPEPRRVDQLTEVFTREHFDAHGDAIDLRGTTYGPEGPVPVESVGPRDGTVPKYDPVTGELIREFDVKTDDRPDPATIPVARRAKTGPRKVINGMDVPAPLEGFTIPLRLLRPINLLVFFFVMVAHAFTQLMAAAIGLGYLLMAPFWLLVYCMILAHFGNVIDETGPTSNDNLPTPLRHLDWHDDTGGPFIRVLMAMTVCYGPGLALLIYAVQLPPAVILTLIGILTIIGTLLFPAALLTATTSGTVLNLRPDRLLGTAMICGPEYLVAVGAWIVGGLAWSAGVIGINAIAMASIDPLHISLPPFVQWYVPYGVLALGVFVMHFFCWHLGTLYRRHHERFPWILQRYESNRPARPTAFPVEPTGPRQRPPQNQRARQNPNPTRM